MIILVGAFLLGACGGHQDDAGNTSAPSITGARGQQIVIRTKLIIAASPGAETIATGEVVQGSTLGGDAFCPGGTIVDTHGDNEFVKSYGLIDRTITCPDGNVRMGLTPEVGPQGPTGKGAWKIVSGTGAYGGLRGSGDLKDVYGPEVDSPTRETLTGTVTS